MPTDSNQMKLRGGEAAPVLSYSVPEPTSYSGRNFIDLALPDSYFRTDIAYTPNVPTQAETLARLKAVQASIRSAPSARELLSASSTAVPLPGGERVSPALAQLDPAEVEAMRAAGKELVLYRNLSGVLSHKFVTPRLYLRTAALPANLTAQFLTARVAITSPAAEANFSGPHTGVEVTITGTAGTSSLGASITVGLIVGSELIHVGTAPQFLDWSQKVTITTSGRIIINAQATDTLGSTKTAEVAINVTLAPPPDTTAPVVVINSPAQGATITGTASGAAVEVKMTATDIQSAIQTVKVSRKGDTTWIPATRQAADQWSCSINLPPGKHTLQAECTDSALIKGYAEVDVTVQVPDTTPPTVVIDSPKSGSDIVGPFEGLDVVVTGRASDDRGVKSVVLKVDGNPSVFLANPRELGDWSTWSGTVRIEQPETRIITAVCTDTAGNESEHSVAVKVILVPDIVSRLNRIILVESCRLSSYLGNYGAGRTLSTFSLLPGEKTKLSVKTFTKTETAAKNASSILDSYSDESAADFETSMGKEQANKTSYDESSKYSVDGEADASWGWGSASVKAGVSGGTNATREEFAKNTANTTQKHVSKASARRDVQINTSYEVNSATGEETAVERVIENVNVSRTLNFVFRQMNQEFITLLHLVDVRLGFFKVVEIEGEEEPRYIYREFTLPEIDTLLEDVLVEKHRAEVKAAIVHQLSNIFDYQGERHAFVEWREIPEEGDPSRYLRMRKDLVSAYKDAATGTEIKIPGIILSASKYVLRTEGIVVDALLGEGEALDAYSIGLQETTVREKKLANDKAEAEVERARLAMRIIQNKDTEAAKLFAQLYPQPVQLVPVPAAAYEPPPGTPKK
ncbi:MAG TPA: Ig-like domain-containing protein [Haliangium sp.]|nr:Ig-like domain-containing protein [Haliangium sp.]